MPVRAPGGGGVGRRISGQASLQGAGIRGRKVRRALSCRSPPLPARTRLQTDSRRVSRRKLKTSAPQLRPSPARPWPRREASLPGTSRTHLRSASCPGLSSAGGRVCLLDRRGHSKAGGSRSGASRRLTPDLRQEQSRQRPCRLHWGAVLAGRNLVRSVSGPLAGLTSSSNLGFLESMLNPSASASEEDRPQSSQRGRGHPACRGG